MIRVVSYRNFQITCVIRFQLEVWSEVSLNLGFAQTRGFKDGTQNEIKGRLD